MGAGVSMQIVAIHHIVGDSAQRARDLSAILGVTAYEARPRVNVAVDGTAVVASFAADDQAKVCISALNNAGFATVCVDSAQLEVDARRFIVRRLCVTAEQLQVWDMEGGTLVINYAEVALLLRGAGIISSVRSDTTTERKFAIGRALATGGLIMRKKVTTTTSSVSSERQPFCHIYIPGAPIVVLRQDVIDYAALGAERKLSRDANFNWICMELRRLCRAAQWDERLQTKPGLAQVLGPVFNPEINLDLAISIVVKSIL